MRLRVVNESKNAILAERATEATGFLERLVGLMGRRHLPPGEGLHIAPCNSIHTFFMRFPIDALFLDADGAIVKLLPSMPPWRASSLYFNARSVLELPAGAAAASATVEGDRLRLERLAP